MQVPALPAIAHDLQVPVQAVAQQTPCAQRVDLQSVSAPQLAPGGLWPQLPLTQMLPARAVGVGRAGGLARSGRCRRCNGEHDWLVGRLAGPRPVAAAGERQRRARCSRPSRRRRRRRRAGRRRCRRSFRSCRSSLAPSSVQSLRGSVLTSAGMQVPTSAGEAQVTQIPVQALLQQTPSAQKPDEQSAARLQGCPSAASRRRSAGRRTSPCPPAARR